MENVVVVSRYYRPFGSLKAQELELAHFLYDHWNTIKFIQKFVANTPSKDIIKNSENGVFTFNNSTKGRQYIFAAVHGDPREATVTVHIEKEYPYTIIVGDSGLGISQSLTEVLSGWTKHKIVIEVLNYIID